MSEDAVLEVARNALLHLENPVFGERHPYDLMREAQEKAALAHRVLADLREREEDRKRRLAELRAFIEAREQEKQQ
jgi:hypothetical protein